MEDINTELEKAEINLELVINKQADDNEIKKLSRLNQIELDRQLPKVAKKLGIKIKTLENEVKKLHQATDEKDNTTCFFKEYEPWDSSVDGEELINDITNFLSTYVVLPKGTKEAIALWIINTYCQELTRISPILTITSPDKRCGKTTLLTLLTKIVKRPLPTSNITAAVLFRLMHLKKPTLIIDEADSFFSGNNELRGIVNSGHTKETAVVHRCVGDDYETKSFDTWGSKAIASIGNLPSTIMDRSIVINLRRKKNGEKVSRLTVNNISVDDLIRKCLRWVSDNSSTLKNADPQLPVGLHDRAGDNWRPLFAIADLIGGDWPELVRKIAVHITPIETDDDAEGIMLLDDIRKIFAETSDKSLRSEFIIDELNKMDERPWPEWKNGKPITTSQIAKLLKPFKIKPKVTRMGTGTWRGYKKDSFMDAFARYLPESKCNSETSEI